MYLWAFSFERKVVVMKKMNVKEMALIGVLGGLAGILMFFRTPLPFMPPFMDFDLAGLPEIIGGFALGPVAAVCIIVVKLIVKVSLMGTSSMFTGELQNLILSIAYVLPAILIYDRHKSKKSAVHGLLVGTILCAICAVFTNLLIIIPFYINLYGMTMEAILAMCSAINPYITNALMFAILGVIPFNLVKNGVVSIVTILLYKKISPILKKYIK